MALDSSYGLEIQAPAPAQTQAADKPLQDPVEAMKQLVDAGNKTIAQPPTSDAQSGRASSTSQPDFLDMGDTGGLYKSQVAKPAADDGAKTADADTKTADANVSAKTGDANVSPKAPDADASPKTSAVEASPPAPTADTSTKTDTSQTGDASPKTSAVEASPPTPSADTNTKTDTSHTGDASPKTSTTEAAAVQDKSQYVDLRGDGSGRTVPASEHTVAKGETIEGIARTTLGPEASQKEVQRYAKVIAGINGITDEKKLQPGTKLDTPAHKKDGSIQFDNPEKKGEHFTIHKDGTLDEKNKADGTSYKHFNVGKNGDYTESHIGPKPEDNYSADYDAKTHNTTITHTDNAGNPVVTDSSGYTKTIDQDGVTHEKYGGDNQTKTEDTTELDGSSVRYNNDGSKVTINGSKTEYEAQDTDGTTTTKYADGTVKVQKVDDQGHETGYSHGPKADGGYQEHGWGQTPKDNYDESYDPKTGTTIRHEGKGTPEEKTTTSWANGTTKVESADGKNYQRNADGSEHHWGKENYDKPAYNYEKDKHLTDAKAKLNQEVNDRVPKENQADFRNDMTQFEARAKRDHLSPEEVAKTYDQMSKMMHAKDGEAVVPQKERAILAEGLMHQLANPGATKQGVDNTCNVTTVMENTLAKNPSKIAQMEAEATLTGQWTAPDGKVIKIDHKSLQPGAQEKDYPPDDKSTRSYATQVANLVMANDALQRRQPPESYVQRNPTFPGDTGERRLDASGKEIHYPQYDAEGETWQDRPDNSPGVTDHEIAADGKRLNGKDYHMLSTDSSQGGIDNIRSAEELQQRLLQYKQQGQLPVTMAVDGNHPPINNNPKPGYGPHVVTIDSYNEDTKTVHISNQWHPEDDKDVDVNELYGNAKRPGTII